MLSLDAPINLVRPACVKFGRGTLSQLAGWIAERGYSRPFVVADPFNAGRLDLLGLNGKRVFGEVEPEPGLANLKAAVSEAGDADVVIGFGGGSAMDLAKLVSVMVGRDVGLGDISGKDRAPAREIGLVQIPTTSGTGSEVGTRALIADPETHNKIATESPNMLADLAIVDADLTMTVPASVTAATGVDALAHCVEAYTSRRAHPVIDGYALEGIRLVGAYLGRAVADGTDGEARSGLALAALYGGVCLGPVNTTAGHALSYPLGTRFGLPHGLANALVFPHVLSANAGACPDKTQRTLEAMGLGSDADPLEGPLAFCQGLGLDMRLRDHGVPESDLPAMAEEAHAIRRLLDWNPRDLSVGDIGAIYERAY